MRRLALATFALTAGCETYYLPVPDLNGDGKAELFAIPTTRTAAYAVRDDERLACITACGPGRNDPEWYGRCVERCDAQSRACGAARERIDPMSLSRASKR